MEEKLILKEQIEILRKKMEEMLEKKMDYHLILETSRELDLLIQQYYEIE